MPSKWDLLRKPNRSQISPLSAFDSRSHEHSPLETYSSTDPIYPQHQDLISSSAERSDYYRVPSQQYQPPETFSQQQQSNYQANFPRRTQSQRTPPSHLYNGQPTVQLVPASLDSEPSIIDEEPAYGRPSLSSRADSSFDSDTKKSKKGFWGKSHSSSKESVGSSHSASKGLGRSISVRRKPPVQQVPRVSQAPQGYEQSSSQWNSPESLSAHLAQQHQGAIVETSHTSTTDYSGHRRVPSITTTISPTSEPQQTHQDYDYPTPDSSRLSRESFQAPSPKRQHQSPRSPAQAQPDDYRPYHNPQRPSDSLSDQFYIHSDNQSYRPPSQQSLGPPSPVYRQPQVIDPPPRTSSHGPPPPQHMQSTMKTAGGQAQGQGPVQMQQHQNGQNRGSGNSGQTQAGSGPPPYSAPSTGNQQNQQQHRDNRQASMPNSQPGSGLSEQGGRHTPPPLKSREDVANLDLAGVLQRYEELQGKYTKVKKYYFEKDAQVQQLQNTLANHRLSLSRNSLDDNEYSTRFGRLNGAINNLAFNIRKDWKAIPPWLQGVVNKDATTIGTKEMTAVGRACITRWLVDEIFDRYFHPALEPGLSSQLKIIEKNIRRFAAAPQSEEEREALISKVSTWRLTTLDGLQEVLASPQATEYRTGLTTLLGEKLNASLQMNLNDPPPPDLVGGVSMIIELAVGISANIPQESREVYVQYFSPGAPVNSEFMNIETPLPALTNPGASPPEGVDADHKSAHSGDTPSMQEWTDDADRDSIKEQSHGHAKKKSVFGGFLGKKSTPSSESVNTRGSGGNGGAPVVVAGPKEERIRFAAFMAAGVRGKSMLLKAPVYT
ncbi:MAG: hypothetical protein M1834_007349 [Cirrosporium novae-zelandiae]|nr:MAG: hypothetical protein M1834_007349 [Cirrosporium novae-zelandiae]